MTPDLAVVIAVMDPRAPVERMLEALRRQTVAESLEVVFVRAAPDVVIPTDGHGFAALHVVDDLTAPAPDRALAAGVPLTTAPLVWLLEDHAFPERTCAELLVNAFSGPWTVVGCAIANGNVGSARLALAELYIGYGAWADPVEPGEQADLPNHNVVYRRDVLERDDLPALLERGSQFHRLLADGGGRFYLSEARVIHVNPSAVLPTVTMRYGFGRLFAADRSAGWGRPRRLAYAAASPLIPAVRLYRLRRDRFGERERRAGLWPRLAPAVVLLLVADAIGQAVGCLAGRGAAIERLADPERRRSDFLNRADRRAYLRGGE